MTKRNETLRLSPEALSDGLRAAGITLRDFCHLFDVGYENGRRWILPEDHARASEPPYWITPVLDACRIESFLIMVRATRADNTATAEDHANAD